MPFKQESSDKLNKLVLSQETSLDCFRQVLILKRNTNETNHWKQKKNIEKNVAIVSNQLKGGPQPK